MTRFDDYLRWHRLQVDTADIDPVYPVLDVFAADADEHQRAWLCMLHVCYYHLGSTLTAYERFPEAAALPASRADLDDAGLLGLPTGTERRAHRSPHQLARHLLAMRDTWADVSPYEWAAKDWDWRALNDRLTTVVGNGRWAAYKAAEMLQKVAGAPTAATDAGHAYSSGPRKGLGLLYADLPAGNDPRTVAFLDAVTDSVADTLGEADVALVETSLCDFASLVGGNYYLGHDIDQMLTQLSDSRISAPAGIWQARADALPRGLLGEHGGWPGIRRNLKRVYADTADLDAMLAKVWAVPT